jgi:hypothetical protein
LLNALIDIKSYDPNYDFNIFDKDGEILSMTISKVIKTSKSSRKYSIKILDSYALLPSSLNKLCENFETDIRKTIFPYDFANKNTLFYKGNKPNIKYYNNIKDGELNKEEYDKIKNKG